MHTPTPAQLLHVWERGGEMSATANALLLLESCCDEAMVDLAALPLGQRDALLLQLRERLFGEEIQGVASCPQCLAMVEAGFRCEDVLHAAAVLDASMPTVEHTLAHHDLFVRFRLPDSRDLISIEPCGSAQQARERLLERCVLAATRDAKDWPVLALPQDMQMEIAQAMGQADPQADVQLAFRCPDCAHEWQPAFDVARFLWQELHAWALRMLREVDVLAHAYHWHEADILALGPRRRQAYLELCAP